MTGDSGEHSHDTDALVCPPGEVLYEAALSGADLATDQVLREAPCLVQQGLLVADGSVADRLIPVDPRVAAATLLGPIEQAIADVHRQDSDLVELFGPLVAVETSTDDDAITLIRGREEIRRALDADVGRLTADDEVLTMHDTSPRDPGEMVEGLRRTLEPLKANASMRTLYPHAMRLDEHTMRLQEWIKDYRVEVRTVAETIDRTFILGPVAYIPASADHGNAYRITDPAIVGFLRHEFDVLWQEGTPLMDPARQLDAGRSLSDDQRRILALHVGGVESDHEVAARLNLNVRTVRAHIAEVRKLLGARTRTHLGALARDSGLLGHSTAAARRDSLAGTDTDTNHS